MTVKKLSIIVPVLNENATIRTVYKKISALKLGVKKEVIIVDDGSDDGTTQFLKKMQASKPRGFIFLFHQARQGKGAAVQTALTRVTGSHVAIQDADLEYEPAELAKLISVAMRSPYGVVFGTRNKDIKNVYIYPLYYWGSKVLTILINALYGYNLSDPETCHKLIPTQAMKKFSLHENGFGIEIELIVNPAFQHLPIYEVPITYHPRSFDEGKKIRTSDGIRAIYLLFKFRLFGLPPKR